MVSPPTMTNISYFHYSVYFLLLIGSFNSPSNQELSSSFGCNSTVADILLLVDISGSVLESIVMDRSFIKDVVNAFPIDGINLRMGLAVFSSVCKTILPVQDGISKGIVFDAIEKPWWPVLWTNMHDCLDQIRKVDLPSRGQTSRMFVVLLITDEQPDNMEKALEAIRRLQNEGAKFFLVLTKEPKVSGIAQMLGVENYVEAIRTRETDPRKPGADARLADKIVLETCQKTCSIEEKDDEIGCVWDQQGNCVKNVDIKPSNPNHPACKNFKNHRKILPCSSEICKASCEEYKWTQWDKACCGSHIGQKIEQSRTRPIPDHLFNAQVCPRKETFVCTIEHECKEVVHRELQ
uniref:VWFA domain-containing protein n=1 Tax=Romanomermis culicivorax TaxID=13658 RepID=A0A915J4S5_ROMCU